MRNYALVDIVGKSEAPGGVKAHCSLWANALKKGPDAWNAKSIVRHVDDYDWA